MPREAPITRAAFKPLVGGMVWTDSSSTCSVHYRSNMEEITAVIGVDVGGTNTDAVIIDKRLEIPAIIAKSKTLTTADITTGVNIAIHRALLASRKENRSLVIQQVNIGTTHFINAVVEGRHLAKVAVIRLCGTASRNLLPFSDFPKHLLSAVGGSVLLTEGGYEYDGREISPFTEESVVECVEELKRNGEKNIVVSGIFSPVRQDHEQRAVDVIKRVYPEASVTASHEIGKIGLLERENAAILNECIKPLCFETINGFRKALDELGLKCPLYLTQNDGTVLSQDKALKFPVLSFASGATNSMRGAAFLSGLKDAIIVDIGGTSTDVGVLLNGFPREATSNVKIGGIRTNFRMPDVVSIGLGGGSYVTAVTSEARNKSVNIGPMSAGYRLTTEALVFAENGAISDRKVTATDIAVASKLVTVGNVANVKHLTETLVTSAVMKIHDMVAACVDQMRFNDRELPLVLVGGGSIILNTTRAFEGISNIVVPANFDVANAVGAALSQISATVDRVIDLDKYIDKPTYNQAVTDKLRSGPEEMSEDQKTAAIELVRKDFHQRAKEQALDDILRSLKSEVIRNGAKPETVALLEKEDVTLAYIPGNATRIKAKYVGDLSVASSSHETTSIPESVYTKQIREGQQCEKQKVSASGKLLSDGPVAMEIKMPRIDEATGEWILSDYDIECITIGAGILGCGGGGSPSLARLLALRALEEGKQLRVVTPSKFLPKLDMDKDIIAGVAFMGAPLILYEKLISGNETIDALKCMQELYDEGKYDVINGKLQNPGLGIEVKTGNGITYIEDYVTKASSENKQSTSGPTVGSKRIAAIMIDEIGGMNGVVPFLVAAELGLPVVDCDGMGRAFPELQMFVPFIYGCNPYPATIADNKSRRAAVLYAATAKHLENHFRETVIAMGCSGGVVLSHLNKGQVREKTVHHSLSRAWRIGDTVLRARLHHHNPVHAVVASQKGIFVLYGKVTDLQRETTGGFNKGKIVIAGLEDFQGKTIEIDFQNEFLICRDVTGGNYDVIVCVPDLITLLDAETAQPIPTEEVGFGKRVAVVGLQADALLTSEKALEFVGPQAFGYDSDVKYVPLGDCVQVEPVAGM